MSPTDERHGSYAGHIAHRKDGEESCQPCKDARTRYEKRYRVYGSTIVQLGEAAYAALCSTPRTEIERAGLHSSHVTRIKANGPDGRVSRKTRDIILAAGRQGHVTRVGAMRRLQALAALGWSTTEVAKVSGVHATNLGVIRRGATKHYIRRDAAAGIAEAYRVLSMRIPPVGTSASWTRTYARNNGWLAPLWWDDDRIDDPTYQPRQARERRERGKRDIVAEWDHLRASGESIHQAARQLGVTVNAIEKAQERARATERQAS